MVGANWQSEAPRNRAASPTCKAPEPASRRQQNQPAVYVSDDIVPVTLDRRLAGKRTKIDGVALEEAFGAR